jgi:helix-turn-helix protein
MSESVVADFTGRFYTHEVANAPPQGRVLLSNRRLVLAADSVKETIPTRDIFDVQVGEVPDKLKMYFNDTVTVAYQDGNKRRMVAIESEGGHIEKFNTILFKILLNGTKTHLRHPARRGGRVTNVDAEVAKLKVSQGTVGFERQDAPVVSIDLDQVIGVERSKREFSTGTHPVVSFRHLDGGVAVTTEAGIQSSRRTNLLGRYVRMRYSDLTSELQDVTVSQEEEEVLVAVYSAPGVSLSKVVEFEPQRLTMVLRSLREKGLIAETREETKLTMKGQIVAGDRLEDVNT